MGRVSLQYYFDKMDKKWVTCDRYTERKERWTLEKTFDDNRQLWFIQRDPIEQSHKKRLVHEGYSDIYAKIKVLLEDLEEI